MENNIITDHLIKAAALLLFALGLYGMENDIKPPACKQVTSELKVCEL